jgi:concentrative nucleoside transporter, CNT family
MRLVFGYVAGGPAPFDSVRPETSFILAFQALPRILIIGVLSTLLYHWRLLQPRRARGWTRLAARLWHHRPGRHVGGGQHLRRHG